ncbi:MAG: isocitrate/isopropylmalate dehydrogenase family protein [Promethearchaeota archaeon]
MHIVTFIPGDGIGPEITNVMRDVVGATGVKINWDVRFAGEAALKKFGNPLPEDTITSITKNKIAIKGPLTTPVGTGYRSLNVRLRKIFDLYAGVRPCKTYKGVITRYENVNLVIFRENTEGLYSGIEFPQGADETNSMITAIEKLQGTKLPPDSALAIKDTSVRKSERFLRSAFEYARKYGRKKVTVIHKANIMKYTDGLFLQIGKKISHNYSEIEFEDVIVDNMALQLVKNPENYDILALPNLYGDIISDLCAGLVGGLGVVPSANIGDNCAIFEATHGSAPKYAGKNKANPTAILLAAVMMLRHIGEETSANMIENAVASTIAEGKYVTYDLKPPEKRDEAVGTKEYGNAVISKIEELS